jgi:hypothetical protein
LKEGRIVPLTTEDLTQTARTLKPSTRAWFESAKNYALYANQGGFYDDVLCARGRLSLHLLRLKSSASANVVRRLRRREITRDNSPQTRCHFGPFDDALEFIHFCEWRYGLGKRQAETRYPLDAFDIRETAFDIRAVSDLDLNNLLEGWPHEPGQFKARKIVGSDGRDKVQLRIDLGLMQMEVSGRPDGQRPHGFESLLQYHQARAKAAEESGKSYVLGEQDLMALQHEGLQYYHRYVSLFQLNDFRNVARDTKRNLELVDFVSEHVAEEEVKWSFEQFRPYVIMMHTRARASIALEEKAVNVALEVIQGGKTQIESFYRTIGQPEWIETSSELAFLNEWLSEVQQNVPLSPLEAMERDLQRAIADEAYERAAELRDAIRKMSHKRPDEPVDH